MSEHVEAIRRQYDAHFVNEAHEDCGWRFGCATVRDLLTALAQAERKIEEETQRCIEIVLSHGLPFGRENQLLNDIADRMRRTP